MKHFALENDFIFIKSLILLRYFQSINIRLYLLKSGLRRDSKVTNRCEQNQLDYFWWWQ